MISRLFACLSLTILLSATASAQFGKPKPTPISAEEYHAERALRDASRLTEGVAGRDIIKPEHGIDLERAQLRFDEAREIYTKLCENRSLPRDQWARNCNTLGDIYRRGMGVAQDYTAARTYYDDACLLGRHVNACMQQAFISQKGRDDDEPDMEHARKLYSFACNLRDPGACAGYGNLLYVGLGGTQDRPRGIRLMQDSCRDGYEWACTRLEEFGLPARINRY